MASYSSFLSEEEFQCSVCLDVFNEPVSTPCGHNFCHACITDYWDSTVVCQCPLCKTTFERRPDLRVNTFISGLAAQFKTSLKVADAGSSSPEEQAASGDVVCDICTDTKLEAVKSCLECLTSYCGPHLEPHQRVAGLKRHTLIDPAENLEDRICKVHNRLLTLFCRAEEVVLCDICATSHHATHDTVPVQREYREKKALLGKTEAEVQQMIQERRQKVQEIKQSVKLSRKDTENEIENSVQSFTALVSDIQESQAELVRVLEERQKAAERQANDFIKDMEQEVTELQEANTRLRDLMHIQDHLRLLQNFPSQSVLPHTTDWSAFTLPGHLGIERTLKSISRSMSQLQMTLSKMNMEMKKSCGDAQMLQDTALWNIQQYEVDVILDPNTAHPLLKLSDDGKQVSYGTDIQRLPVNAKMFMKHLAVLGKTGYSSFKFYFEVYVGRKTEWNLGVATESITRTRAITRHLRSGLWALCFKVDQYETFNSPGVAVHYGKVERVGVFVEYDKGHISFYDVEAAAPIHAFTGCHFTENLYPYFNPCDNEFGSNLAPLIIVPVDHIDWA
ncbi:E3 ubiquitin-protein ligase TRIM39-like [Diretmus argenteus]